MDVHLKSWQLLYLMHYKKEEMDEKTVMGVEGRVCEESGEEVELEGER